MDEPMPTEGATLTPSSSGDLTDEQHTKQNEEVTLAALEFLPRERELSVFECAYLLHCIVECSKGKLHGAFADVPNALRLIRENPKLKFALHHAWRTKDYKEIRRSGGPHLSSLVGS